MVVSGIAPTRASKIFTDPLVASTLGITLSASFWIACSQLILSSVALSVAGATLGAVNLIALGSYICHHRNEIYYEASLLYGIARNYLSPDSYSWWNKVDEGLYFGAIPLHEYNHQNLMPHFFGNKLAILSVLEPFELEDHYVFTTAVAPKEWHERGIKTLQLPTLDCTGVDQATIAKGIQFIRNMQAEGRAVYVHCKAGVGRSATIIACKILQDGLADGTKFHSVADVVQYMRNIRNHVTIYRGHAKAAIETFFANLDANT